MKNKSYSFKIKPDDILPFLGEEFWEGFVCSPPKFKEGVTPSIKKLNKIGGKDENKNP